jgi:hypothetical protein
MPLINYESLADVRKLVGSEIGVSPIMRIDQQRIDDFAAIISGFTMILNWQLTAPMESQLRMAF